MLRAHSHCSLCPEVVEVLPVAEVAPVVEVALDQLTFPVEQAEQQEEGVGHLALVAILAREARVDTQEVPALQEQVVTQVALVDLVPVVIPEVLVVTQEEVLADPVLGVIQALELEDLVLAVILDQEAVGLVPVATLLEEDTALGQNQALVDKPESLLVDLVVLRDQAVTEVLVVLEAPEVLEVLVVLVVPVARKVLEALGDLVVMVVPVVPVAPEVLVDMVVRAVLVVPEVLVVMVARVVLEVPVGMVVPVAPQVLVVLGVLVVRKDQVDPRDPGVLEALVVMEDTEDPEQDLHRVALAHTWRVVVLVLGLIQVLVPRLHKVAQDLLPADIASFLLGLAQHLQRTQVHQGLVPIREQALVLVHQEPVHNPEEVEHGKGLSTQAPLLVVPEVVATTRLTAGHTQVVPDIPAKTGPASCQGVLRRDLVVEAGVAGRRVAMGHL